MKIVRRKYVLFRPSCVMATVALLLVVSLVVRTYTTSATFYGGQGVIAYQKDASSVAVVSPDGTGTTQIISGTGVTDIVWSPDGKYIAYVRSGGTPELTGIFMSDANGLNEIRLTPETVIGPMSWSPDGTGLLIRDAGSHTLYYYNLADNSYRQVLDAAVEQPLWSPDGTRIAFGMASPEEGSAAADNDVEVYVLNLTSGSYSQLTDNTAYDSPRDWSPDSGRIAYISTDGAFGDRRLKFMDADGNNKAAFYNTSVDEGDYNMYSAVYSPDGTGIVYSLRKKTGTDIYITKGLTASEPTRIIATNVAAESPVSWQSTAATTHVYHFVSETTGHHLFTSDLGEALRYMKDKENSIWRYKGIAFTAASVTSCPVGQTPAYAFRNGLNDTRLYTTNEIEKQTFLSDSRGIWRYEGTAFCASEQAQSSGLPVHRFWSSSTESYFYTTSEDDKQKVIDSFDDVDWYYEGIVFYVTSI